MRESHPLEAAVGIDYYYSDTPGIGGGLRDTPEDFRVSEIEAMDHSPVDADPGAYPHLLLRVTLKNWDTNDFARALSNHLGISRERVSWAGTKDKRAITTQLFTVEGINPEALPTLSNADIEIVGRTGRPILFGDLAGNAFEIRIHDAEEPEHVPAVTDQLRSLAGGDDSMVGVPNVFGQQRFGSYRPVTHDVGLALIRDGWEAAVMAYVGNPAETEPKQTRAARAYVEETRDWAGAIERFPDGLRFERAMLHRLAEGDDEAQDFRDALEQVPGNLQQLFVHAAQSFVFNRILSRRLERDLPFGRPVAGDVVCFADRDAPDGIVLPDTDRTQRVPAERVDAVTRHCTRRRAFVTAPLVGTETEFADGEPGEIERKVCESVGIEPADFALPGTFESTGTRRAVLLTTNLDGTTDPVTLSFRLPRGSYATVVLREYLKCDPRDL